MLLRCQDVEKRFGGIVALRAGNLEVAAGEVHLLMGENGAGKSTLMKIVAGMQQRDGGQMLWRDASVSFRSPVEAAQEGIAMVHQESLLAPHLSVAENLFLGREGRSPFGWVGRRAMTSRAAEVIAEHGFPLRAQQLVSDLSPAGRQLAEICRAILHGTRLLIFDEPTSALSEHETQEVFRIVRGLKDRGAGVIYITHRLEELRSVGDRITILRDGATVHSGPLSGIAREEMIRHMVGREVTSLYRREPLPPGPERLRIESLNCPPALRNVSLAVRQGEIVGLGGLIGAGRTELCRAIFGVDRATSGRIWIDGKVTSIQSPRQAVAAGIALIPEDRQRTGLARDLSVSSNLTLASLMGLSRFGMLDAKRGQAAAQQQIEQLRIKTSGVTQQAGRLSGGNQQKVVIGKWLARGAQVFLFDEPTRGIDVAAKVEVFELMDRLARQGAAILMVSSELPELLQVADRVLVMRQGQIVAELPKTTTQEEIMHHASIEEAAS